MNLGHRHRFLRRKGHPLTLKSGVDVLALSVSLLSLFFTIDQVRLIWIEKNAAGVSVISWTFYTLSAFIWLLYGILHKDKIITYTNLLWVAFSFFIVIGVLMYR